ncbi:hypothetical protein EVB27_050 [Rhizobium phage RHph_TM16]|nr:hypothetical protein EVB27_050 [Rhizobium phage RHph_TM16]
MKLKVELEIDLDKTFGKKAFANRKGELGLVLMETIFKGKMPVTTHAKVCDEFGLEILSIDPVDERETT